jgi:hypothetical protein
LANSFRPASRDQSHPSPTLFSPRFLAPVPSFSISDTEQKSAWPVETVEEYCWWHAIQIAIHARLRSEWNKKVYIDNYDCVPLTYESRRSSPNSDCQTQTAGGHKHDPESEMPERLMVLSYIIGLLDNGLGWLLASIPLYACGALGDFGDFYC